MTPRLGIYEKALPKDFTWEARFLAAKEAGFDFVEISIDETDERMVRLNCSQIEKWNFINAMRNTDMTVPSMCLSAHRKIPFGSSDPAIAQEAKNLMEKAIRFASETGIRVIQLAGYDVYYEKSTLQSQERYYLAMEEALQYAARYQVTLALEIMDTTFMNSITKYLRLKERLPSPWFWVYPDLGNVSAWGNDIAHELTIGIDHIVGIHVKETRSVTPTFPGAFRDVPFGEGCVDFEHCFRVLHNLHYAGPFLIEMWTEKAKDPLAEIKKARAFVLEKMKKGGFSC